MALNVNKHDVRRRYIAGIHPTVVHVNGSIGSKLVLYLVEHPHC